MKCNVCKKTKERSEFPNTLCGRCKECKYAYTRQWKAENREKVNTSDREWRSRNIDKYNESQRKTYHKYIDRRRKETLEHYHRKSKEYGSSLATVYRNGGRQVIKELFRNKECAVCGTNEDINIHHKDNQGRHNLRLGLKPNNNITNLEILCRSCHTARHQREKVYGQ